MPTLMDGKKQLSLDMTIKPRQQLNEFHPKNTRQSLELLENQLTLSEIESCFLNQDPENINVHLMKMLSVRWDRIRNSSLCYTQQPTNLINQLCLEIAAAITPLAPNNGTYSFLMPSLENFEDFYGDNIHDLGLYEFILSDKERVFIPIAKCLFQASISDEGKLKQMVAIDQKDLNLTDSEVRRVSKHSKQADAFYLAVIKLNQNRLFGNSIGVKLQQLSNALRLGGAHATGAEDNAGNIANVGIIEFSEYWEALPKQDKSSFFNTTPKLKNILGRLFRPNDVNYRDVRFCVELLAGELEPIIRIYNKKPDIEKLKKHVKDQSDAFTKAAQSSKGLDIIINTNSNSPKHIVDHLFKLITDEQDVPFNQSTDIKLRGRTLFDALKIAITQHQKCIKYIIIHLATLPMDEQLECLVDELDGPYKNIIFYMADKQPALFDELINQIIKQNNEKLSLDICSIRNKNGMTSLMLAAKLGSQNSLERLLNIGLNVNASDKKKKTVLCYAVASGNKDTVNYLLENGALLEALVADNATVLSVAVKYGNEDIVDLLLTKNANINARDTYGKNPLDHAIKNKSKLIDLILMHVATLPIDKQAQCLPSMSGEPYENVYAYVAIERPEHLNYLILNAPHADTSDIIKKLSPMHFDGHLQLIRTHFQQMKQKSRCNSNYIPAAKAAKTLLIECVQAKMILLQSKDDIDTKMREFKTTCTNAINKAKPILATHREVGRAITSLLLAIITLPVALPLYAMGMFSHKTQSALLLDQLQEPLSVVSKSQK